MAVCAGLVIVVGYLVCISGMIIATCTSYVLFHNKLIL